MEVGERDPVTGRHTTGHVWNGIKELDTPIPRAVIIFLIVTHAFALIWWVLMPAWPLGTTYTKGLLGIDQKTTVTQKVQQADAERSSWAEQIESLSFAEIKANPKLMTVVKETGHQLFGDNCAACHGSDAKGRINYPDLTDDDWLWGGSPEAIAETMRVGINSAHAEGRVAQMPAFGRDQMLSRTEVEEAANYVYSLGHPNFSTPANVKTIEAGHEVFLANCAACHGEDAKGNQELGAPNLTDNYWLYGGDLDTIIATVHGGRQGHMPTWESRLSSVDIKILALYVNSLRGTSP
ncbi:MAG TPA: cytochrome-c oxidase, cbb3-type subunit III [Aurantimonas sp.]